MIRLEVCNIITNTITEIEYKPGNPLPAHIKVPWDNLGLFIDPSTTSMGMTIAHLGKKAPILGIGIRRGHSSDSKEMFVEEFGMLLQQILQEVRIDFVMAENQYIDRRKVDAYAALKLIMSKISLICKICQVKFEKILPTVWKSIVLDMYPGYIDKRKSNKEEVRSVMTKILPQTLSIRTTDVFDSLGIAYYYLTEVVINNSQYRDDLPFMVTYLANGIGDYDDYEILLKQDRGDYKKRMTEDMKAFNRYFFDTCKGNIIKVGKNNSKEFRKHFRVEVKKIEINKNDNLIGIFKEHLEIIKNRDKRPVDYIVPNTDMAIKDIARGYMGTRNNHIGVMFVKPYKKMYQELFWGRDNLGRIDDNHYILTVIRR